MLMHYLDNWVLNVSTPIASYFGVVNNASQTILMNVYRIFFFLSASFSYSVSALVGQSIGKGKINKAKHFHRLSHALIQMVNVVLVILIFSMPRAILGIYI